MWRPECSALKSEMPSTPRMTASPSITNRLCPFFSAASTIRIALGPVVTATGYRPHAVAFALEADAVAVILDFVKPLRGGRHTLTERAKREPVQFISRTSCLAKCWWLQLNINATVDPAEIEDAKGFLAAYRFARDRIGAPLIEADAGGPLELLESGNKPIARRHVTFVLGTGETQPQSRGSLFVGGAGKPFRPFLFDSVEVPP